MPKNRDHYKNYEKLTWSSRLIDLFMIELVDRPLHLYPSMHSGKFIELCRYYASYRKIGTEDQATIFEGMQVGDGKRAAVGALIARGMIEIAARRLKADRYTPNSDRMLPKLGTQPTPGELYMTWAAVSAKVETMSPSKITPSPVVDVAWLEVLLQRSHEETVHIINSVIKTGVRVLRDPYNPTSSKRKRKCFNL